MNKIIAVISIIMMTFATQSCLSSLPKANKGKEKINKQVKLEKDSNIAVVSVLSDTFNSVYLGVSRLTNKEYQSDITHWKLNEFITGLTKEAIEQDAKYQFIDIGIEREQFRKVYNKSAFSENNYKIENISDLLEELSSKYNADYLVLVIENTIEDPIKDTTNDFTGYGIYRNAISFKSTYLYSYYRVLLVDTDSKKIVKQKEIVDYSKLPKEFWAENIDNLPAKLNRYLRTESLRTAGRNVLRSLVRFGVINEQVAYTTESGTRFVTNRVEQTGNYGELYEDAVNRVYKALDIEKHFERYAIFMRSRHDENVAEHFTLYEDIYLNWMKEYVSWDILKSRMIEEYRKEFTADELNEIADFAETEAGSKMLNKIPLILNRQEDIWIEEAKKHIEILDKAVVERREKIIN